MDARHPTLLRRDEPQPPVGTAPRRSPGAPPFRPALFLAPAPAPALPPPDPAALALLLRHADLDLDLVTGLIALDPTLSARVLRLANSVTYNRGVPVRSLAEAVARLGFAPLLQLMNPPPPTPRPDSRVELNGGGQLHVHGAHRRHLAQRGHDLLAASSPVGG
jgi:hypothetical protein